MKNSTLNATPPIVASRLVSRFTMAVVNNTADTKATPNGISRLPMCRFPGTFHLRRFGETQHQHGQRLHGKTPDHAEGIQPARVKTLPG